MAGVVRSQYTVYTGELDRGLKLAVVADLHSRAGAEVLDIIRAVKDMAPDLVLMPGDIFERLDGKNTRGMQAGLSLMRACAQIAPTVYSIGNHENGGTRSWNKLKWMGIKSIPKYFDAEQIEMIKSCGVTLLDDSYTLIDGIAIGGLSSGLINLGRRPDLEFLNSFCHLDSPKILLCHHPEYFDKYLSDKNIMLTVSGHAHGGQWRIFGRGVFAPGQGLFPKYTSGIYNNALAVSRGLKPGGLIPRIFNSTEVMEINLLPKE